MKTLDELRELLCTVPETEEELMELRMWCLIKVPWVDEISTYIDWDFKKEILLHRLSSWEIRTRNRVINFTILSNPIQERHLRMYCSSEWWNCDIQSNNLVHIWRSTLWEDDKVIEEWKLLYYNSSLCLFQQSKKTIADILTFLKG